MTAVERPAPPSPTARRSPSALDRSIVIGAVVDALRKLDPRVQARNPVMFVVEIGAAVTTVTWLAQVLGTPSAGPGTEPAWFTCTVSVWLWLTVLFANLAEALAEGRGRAQAASLRAMRSATIAQLRDGSSKPASDLRRTDIVVVEAGQVIPGDGTVVEGRHGQGDRRHRRPHPPGLLRTARSREQAHRLGDAAPRRRLVHRAGLRTRPSGHERQREVLGHQPSVPRHAYRPRRPTHPDPALHATLERQIERFFGTLDTEWAHGRVWPDSTQRDRALASFIRFYNRRRPHSATGGRPPISRVHQVRGHDI